ncbi:ECF-type sigma factor [Roseateles sp. P5_E11]
MAEVTELLRGVAAGEPGAADQLYSLLYPELSRLARRHLHAVGPVTLDPPALIHELWLRTRGMVVPAYRAQFFALASRVMRSVVVDQLRRRHADKRGGGVAEVTLNTSALLEFAATPEGEPVTSPSSQAAQGMDPIRLDEALNALAAIDERAHRVVEMRFYGGMTQDEIADLLGVSVPTVKRDWRRARAFLFEQLRG